MKVKTKNQIAGLLFVSLPIIGIILFSGIPLIVSFILSFGHLSSFDLFDIEFIAQPCHSPQNSTRTRPCAYAG